MDKFYSMISNKKIPGILLALVFFAVMVGHGKLFPQPRPEDSLIIAREKHLLTSINDPAKTTSTHEAHSILNANYKAPEIQGLKNWMNSKAIPSISHLKGKVVMVDFWTHGCINCIHTLPHIQSLYDKYKNKGLIVLGIHTPEFDFEHKAQNVQKAVKKYRLTFPVAMDNDLRTWNNFHNRYWPAIYLIDKNGSVRYTHFGEGRYKDTERAVKLLLELE